MSDQILRRKILAKLERRFAELLILEELEDRRIPTSKHTMTKEFLISVGMDERTRFQLTDLELKHNLETVLATFFEIWSLGTIPSVSVNFPGVALPLGSESVVGTGVDHPHADSPNDTPPSVAGSAVDESGSGAGPHRA